MAYLLTVLEPGKKVRKLWAGKGDLTTKRIYAVQYPDDKRTYLEEWCVELNRDNPGYDFAIKHITGGESIYG
jgi:hypothetical protein